jgi:ribosomal protein S1
MSHTEPAGSLPAWEDFTAHHGVGDLVDGQVTKVLPFGAFIRVAEGFDGLLVGADRPELGSTVSARIADLDHEKHRMKLVIP